jgi:hypothetical protein
MIYAFSEKYYTHTVHYFFDQVSKKYYDISEYQNKQISCWDINPRNGEINEAYNLSYKIPEKPKYKKINNRLKVSTLIDEYIFEISLNKLL